MSLKMLRGFALTVLLLTGCREAGAAIAGQTLGPVDPQASGTVTLLHFNDLHAHLTPHMDLVPDAPLGGTSAGTKVVERGGLARLATLVKQLRAAAPGAVLMNIGDTYHGGVEALFTNGNAIVAPVNALGIDVGVPGNWDFAYGPVITRLRYTGVSNLRMAQPSEPTQRPVFPNLAANVTYTLPLQEQGQPMLPATLVKDVGGVRIGFIGITSDIVPTMSDGLAFGFDFVQGETAYRDLIDRHAAELRGQGAHVVVVMSELGIQKDYRLAQLVQPGVDVFFSAHTHEATFQPLTSASGALVVEAGNDGYLGRMELTVTAGRVSGSLWELLPIGQDVPEDPEMKALVEAARAPFLSPTVNMGLPDMGGPMEPGSQRLTQPIDTVVGHAQQPLDRRHALESSFNNAFTDLLRARAGTQVAMTPGFRFDAVVAAPGTPLEDNTLATGAVTLEDAYRFFPAPYTLAKGEVSGARLKEIYEQLLVNVFSPDVFKQGGGWVDGFSGVDLSVDLSLADGQRVLQLRHSDTGLPVGDTELLTIAGCQRPADGSDVLCSHSGFTNVQDFVNPATGVAWTPVDLFVAALPSLTASSRDSVTDTSGTVFWPASPFVQPLTGVAPY